MAAARKALLHLINMSDADVAKLQRALEEVAPSMLYRLRSDRSNVPRRPHTAVRNWSSLAYGNGEPPDAVDVLLSGLERQIFSRRHASEQSWPHVQRQLQPERLHAVHAGWDVLHMANGARSATVTHEFINHQQ